MKKKISKKAKELIDNLGSSIQNIDYHMYSEHGNNCEYEKGKIMRDQDYEKLANYILKLENKIADYKKAVNSNSVM